MTIKYLSKSINQSLPLCKIVLQTFRKNNLLGWQTCGSSDDKNIGWTSGSCRPNYVTHEWGQVLTLDRTEQMLVTGHGDLNLIRGQTKAYIQHIKCKGCSKIHLLLDLPHLNVCNGLSVLNKQYIINVICHTVGISISCCSGKILYVELIRVSNKYYNLK